jgi:transglutaminase-like putative cysteine protease
MKRLTIEAIHSQAPRHAALDLIRSDHVSDPKIFAAVLYNWIRTVVIIVDEFEELLISPLIMLEQIRDIGATSGDCDDVAMLAASMLASMGAEVRLVACFPQSDGSYAHVLTRYRFPREENFTDFDATILFPPAYPEDVLSIDIIS